MPGLEGNQGWFWTYNTRTEEPIPQFLVLQCPLFCSCQLRVIAGGGSRGRPPRLYLMNLREALTVGADCWARQAFELTQYVSSYFLTFQYSYQLHTGKKPFHARASPVLSVLPLSKLSVSYYFLGIGNSWWRAFTAMVLLQSPFKHAEHPTLQQEDLHHSSYTFGHSPSGSFYKPGTVRIQELCSSLHFSKCPVKPETYPLIWNKQGPKLHSRDLYQLQYHSRSEKYCLQSAGEILPNRLVWTPIISYELACTRPLATLKSFAGQVCADVMVAEKN